MHLKFMVDNVVQHFISVEWLVRFHGPGRTLQALQKEEHVTAAKALAAARAAATAVAASTAAAAVADAVEATKATSTSAAFEDAVLKATVVAATAAAVSVAKTAVADAADVGEEERLAGDAGRVLGLLAAVHRMRVLGRDAQHDGPGAYQ